VYSAQLVFRNMHIHRTFCLLHILCRLTPQNRNTSQSRSAAKKLLWTPAASLSHHTWFYAKWQYVIFLTFSLHPDLILLPICEASAILECQVAH